MLEFKTDEAFALIEFTIDGYLSRSEYEEVVRAFDDMIERHERVNVVEVIRNFEGMDHSLWWQDVKWSFGHLKNMGRCAVVTDSGWIGPVVRFVAAVMPAEIRVFSSDKLIDARAWARTG